MSDREKREWKDGRYKIAETLEDAAGVLLGERAISLLVEPIRELSVAVSQGQRQFDWRTVEAALYCVRSTFTYGQEAPNEMLCELFGSLPQMPKIPKLQYTVALTCQAYADWIASPGAAQASPRLAEGVFQLVSEGLLVPESSYAAAQAFFHLCDAMSKVPGHPSLGGLVPKVMQAVQAAHPAGDMARLRPTGQQVLELSEVDVHQILKAATVLARQLRDEQAVAVARALLEPPLSALAAAAAGDVTVGSRDHQVARMCVDRCSTVVRFAPGVFSDTVSQVLVGAWPSLTRVLDAVGTDMDSAESIARLLRYSIKSLGPAKIQPLVAPLCHLLPTVFAAQRHSCYLFLASELVKSFGPSPNSASMLSPLFQALLQGALG